MTVLRKKSWPRVTSRTSAARTLASAASAAMRAGQRRADELGELFVEGRQQLWHETRIRVALEICVGDGPQSIVRIGGEPLHLVGNARIRVSGEQHERAISHVAIRMLSGGLQEGGDGHRPRGAPNQLGSLCAIGVSNAPRRPIAA